MWARIRSLVRGVGSRSRMERDMDEELRFHLEARADDLVTRRNLAPQDARRLARVEFGSVEKYKEETREARGLRLIDAVRGDLRYSVRQLRAYPVFTAAAVLTLALGIGPNAAMATIISGIFRPLPVADAHQMTVLATTLSANRRVRQRLAYPDLQDYKSSSAAFSDMAAWDLNPVGLTADGQTDRLMATVVSGDYFSTLRLEPAAGRLILPSDGELGGAEPIVVLGHSVPGRGVLAPARQSSAAKCASTAGPSPLSASPRRVSTAPLRSCRRMRTCRSSCSSPGPGSRIAMCCPFA